MDGNGVLMMALANLATEMPEEASNAFGKALLPCGSDRTHSLDRAATKHDASKTENAPRRTTRSVGYSAFFALPFGPHRLERASGQGGLLYRTVPFHGFASTDSLRVMVLPTLTYESAQLRAAARRRG